MIKEILDSTPKEHKSSGKFSISSIGCCWRKKYMEIKGLYKQSFDQKTQRTFTLGNLVHESITEELLRKCEQAGLYLVAGEIDIPPQKYISGRCDRIFSVSQTGELIILEIKSVSQWSFNKVKNGDYELLENYKKQLQLYLHFFKIKKGVLLFVNKSSSDILELNIEYDEQLCLSLIKEIEDFFINYIDKNMEPSKCEGGMFGCDCCGVYPQKANAIEA